MFYSSWYFKTKTFYAVTSVWFLRAQLLNLGTMYLTTLYFGFFPIYAFPGIQERVTMRLIPPTKLREGNVFSGVNLSVSLFTGGPTIQGPVPSIRARLTRTSVYSPPPPDMFRLVPLGPYCLDQPDPSPGHIQTCTNLDLPVQGTHAPTPRSAPRNVQTCSL